MNELSNIPDSHLWRHGEPERSSRITAFVVYNVAILRIVVLRKSNSNAIKQSLRVYELADDGQFDRRESSVLVARGDEP